MPLQKYYSNSFHISNQAEPLPLSLHKKHTSNLLYPSSFSICNACIVWLVVFSSTPLYQPKQVYAFLLSEILNFQGSARLIGVGSFSKIFLGSIFLLVNSDLQGTIPCPLHHNYTKRAAILLQKSYFFTTALFFQIITAAPTAISNPTAIGITGMFPPVCGVSGTFGIGAF